MSARHEISDVTFVGGGPVGLYGAHYAGSRGLSARVVDSQPQLGGRLIALYPDKTIYDVAGHPRVLSRDLISHLVDQAKTHDTEFRMDERVTGLRREDDGTWTLLTARGEHRSRTVVVAAGAGAFVPSSMEMPGAASLAGRGLYFDVGDIEPFRGKRVLIVGGGDNALDWAVKIRPVAKSVVLAHRHNRLNAPERAGEKVDTSGIDIRYPYFELEGIEGEERVRRATIFDTSTGERERLDVDALVLNVGYLVNLSDFEAWGLKVEGNGIAVDERMRTNLPGVFAAGDIVTHPGKIKLISTGAGEAAVAVGSVVAYMKRGEREQRKRAAGIERVFERAEGFHSPFEAVQLAVAMERDGVEFYRRAFMHASNPDVKLLFAHLQKNKYDGMRVLRNDILPRHAGGEYAYDDLDDTALAYLREVSDPFGFGGHQLARYAEVHPGADLQSLYTAIRIEEDIINLLQRLAREADMGASRDDIEALVRAEHGSLDELRKTQKLVMETGAGL